MYKSCKFDTITNFHNTPNVKFSMHYLGNIDIL